MSGTNGTMNTEDGLQFYSDSSEYGMEIMSKDIEDLIKIWDDQHHKLAKHRNKLMSVTENNYLDKDMLQIFEDGMSICSDMIEKLETAKRTIDGYRGDV